MRRCHIAIYKDCQEDHFVKISWGIVNEKVRIRGERSKLVTENSILSLKFCAIFERIPHKLILKLRDIYFRDLELKHRCKLHTVRAS